MCAKDRAPVHLTTHKVSHADFTWGWLFMSTYRHLINCLVTHLSFFYKILLPAQIGHRRKENFGWCALDKRLKQTSASDKTLFTIYRSSLNNAFFIYFVEENSVLVFRAELYNSILHLQVARRHHFKPSSPTDTKLPEKDSTWLLSGVSSSFF